MKPPDDAVETIGSFTWMSEGIVFTQSKGKSSSHQAVSEVFGVVRDLIGGTPRPLLADNRKFTPGAPDVWKTVISNLESTCTAVAIIITPDQQNAVGPFPETINQMVIPFRTFTDEAAALEFLEGFAGSRSDAKPGSAS